jgi:hypothetical protein
MAAMLAEHLSHENRLTGEHAGLGYSIGDEAVAMQQQRASRIAQL